MKKIFLLIVIFAIVLCQDRKKEEVDEVDGILQLNKNNYDFAIQKHSRLIVLFVTYGCNLCDQFKLVFQELAHRLKDYEIAFGQVIAAENKALSIRMNSQSYPAAYLYMDGQKKTFPTDDSVEMLFEYALQNQYGYLTNLRTLKDIELFKKRSNIAVITNFSFDQLSDIAFKYKWIKFGIIDSEVIQNSHKCSIHNKALDNEIFYDGSIENLENFINENAYPLVFSFTEEEFKKAEYDGLPLVGLVLDPSTFNEFTVSYFKVVASEFIGKLRFVVINTSAELTMRRFQHFVGQSLEFNKLYYYNYYTKYTTSKGFDEASIPMFRRLVELIQIYNEPYWFGNGYVHDLTPLNYNIQITKNPNHVFVLAIKQNCELCSQYLDIFIQLSIKYEHRRNLVFSLYQTSSHYIREMVVEDAPQLFIFIKQDGLVTQDIYNKQFSLESLSQYIENTIPLDKYLEQFPATQSVEIDNNNYQSIIENSNQPIIFWFYNPNCEHSKALNKIIEQLIDLYKKEIEFYRTDGIKYQFDKFKIDKYPSLYFINQKKQQLVKFDQQIFSRENLIKFINEQLESKNKYDNIINYGTVITLTKDNFKDIVLKTKQHVFVKFYAPWCGHCKSMAKEYELLAQQFRGSTNVLIAEMDWTTEQVSDVSVTGFPTLIFFYKDGGIVDPIKYNKQRTAAQIKEFIQEYVNLHDEL